MLAWIALLLLGASQDTADYNLTASTTPANVTAGLETTYELRITPKGAWKTKTETPFKADLSAPKQVTLAKTAFANADLTSKDGSNVITTTFKAAKGEHTIDAAVTFFLCTDQICQRFKDKLSLPIKVP